MTRSFAKSRGFDCRISERGSRRLSFEASMAGAGVAAVSALHWVDVCVRLRVSCGRRRGWQPWCARAHTHTRPRVAERAQSALEYGAARSDDRELGGVSACFSMGLYLWATQSQSRSPAYCALLPVRARSAPSVPDGRWASVSGGVCGGRSKSAAPRSKQDHPFCARGTRRSAWDPETSVRRKLRTRGLPQAPGGRRHVLRGALLLKSS